MGGGCRAPGWALGFRGWGLWGRDDGGDVAAGWAGGSPGWCGRLGVLAGRLGVLAGLVTRLLAVLMGRLLPAGLVAACVVRVLLVAVGLVAVGLLVVRLVALSWRWAVLSAAGLVVRLTVLILPATHCSPLTVLTVGLPGVGRPRCGGGLGLASGFAS